MPKSAKKKTLIIEDVKIKMPLATAKWLIRNTKLSFNQIAKFCDLHNIQVKAISDGKLMDNLLPKNPIGFQLTREEIERCENDHKEQLKLCPFFETSKLKRKNRKKFVSSALKEQRPSVVLWLLKNHYNFSDKNIATLVGSTSKYVAKIRNYLDENDQYISDIAPKDPVTLGFCSTKDIKHVEDL